MEEKTKVIAEDGRLDLLITRDFDLPVDLLYRAFSERELFAQWMGTEVVTFENRAGGLYKFQTAGPDGKVAFSASGVFHEFEEDRRIVRTFRMDVPGFDVQLEFLDFVALNDDSSRLNMQCIYRSAEHREKQLKLPFAFGINMAHNRLQQILKNL